MVRQVEDNFILEDPFLFQIILQASGVKVSEEVKLKFDEVKKKKTYRYVIFYIKEEKAISVEKTGKKP